MMNSISTIFTMDIYRSYLRPKAGQSELVRTGRWASFISLLIAVCIAPLLSGLDQAFHYIQEFTGFVSRCIGDFSCGFFYRRATANGALSAALGSFVFSTLLKVLCRLCLGWIEWESSSCCVAVLLFCWATVVDHWNNAPLFMLHYFIQVSCLIFFLHHHCHSDWFLLALVVKEC